MFASLKEVRSRRINLKLSKTITTTSSTTSTLLCSEKILANSGILRIDGGLVLYHVHTERIYCTKADYHIALTEDILENDAKLRRGVKKVIVGLLKDKIKVDDTSDSEDKKILLCLYISIDITYRRL
ncbi:10045_t:CDS:1 [Paraglomus brasilianum]|uniref:10045_t:CDS:1 n=1 Tax=Paraglomus brasilianum TaxID=144538 RepID=A0A9N9C7F2_9GLOM|nr:10045_t:CDS:1 [Paraglomus brasilianum]